MALALLQQQRLVRAADAFLSAWHSGRTSHMRRPAAALVYPR
jgi:hypothetical protein